MGRRRRRQPAPRRPGHLPPGATSVPPAMLRRKTDSNGSKAPASVRRPSRHSRDDWLEAIRDNDDEIAPLIGVAFELNSQLTSMGMPRNTCVQTCLIMKHALKHLGIHSDLEAVGIAFETKTTEGHYRLQDDPWSFEDEPKFSGHAVLVVPFKSAFADPSIEQFDQSAEARNLPPLLAPELPEGLLDLGDIPLTVPLDGCEITYVPHPRNRAAWHHPMLDFLRDPSELMELGATVGARALRLLEEVKPSAI